MTDTIQSRRGVFRIAAAGALATAAMASGAVEAEAYQGNMERALSSLYDALASLRESTPNKAATGRRLFASSSRRSRKRRPESPSPTPMAAAASSSDPPTSQRLPAQRRRAGR